MWYIGYDIICTDDEWKNALYLLLKAYLIIGQIKLYFIQGLTLLSKLNVWKENKSVLFDPNEIKQSNYNYGPHKWFQIGKVIYPTNKQYILHYKYTGENIQQIWWKVKEIDYHNWIKL